MKDKTTIYHNETLQSTKYYSMLMIGSLRFFWLIVTSLGTMVGLLHDDPLFCCSVQADLLYVGLVLLCYEDQNTEQSAHSRVLLAF